VTISDNLVHLGAALLTLGLLVLVDCPDATEQYWATVLETGIEQMQICWLCDDFAGCYEESMRWAEVSARVHIPSPSDIEMAGESLRHSGEQVNVSWNKGPQLAGVVVWKLYDASIVAFECDCKVGLVLQTEVERAIAERRGRGQTDGDVGSVATKLSRDKKQRKRPAKKIPAAKKISKKKKGRQQQYTKWEATLARLAVYKAAHGDCNVPQRWPEDPPLGRWVSKQRVYKQPLDRGDPSPGMTAARAARLTALGFAWDPEHIHRQATHARLATSKAAHGDCNLPAH
jgi:hypothetical protein